jgi:hypothetical protein
MKKPRKRNIFSDCRKTQFGRELWTIRKTEFGPIPLFGFTVTCRPTILGVRDGALTCILSARERGMMHAHHYPLSANRFRHSDASWKGTLGVQLTAVAGLDNAKGTDLGATIQQRPTWVLARLRVADRGAECSCSFEEKRPQNGTSSAGFS